MTSILVSSLSRLYPNKVTDEKIKSMVVDGKLTTNEYKEITGKEYLA